MDPLKFIEQISKRTAAQRAMNIKQMKSFLNKVLLTRSLHIMLLRYDALNYTNWIQNSFDYNSPHGQPLHEDLKFSIKFSMPYVSEKLIVQSNKKLRKNKFRDEYILNHLQNAQKESGNIKTNKESTGFINKLFFFYAYEQMTVQEKPDYRIEVVRLLKLYKDYPEVNELLEKEIGLNLEELCIYILIFIVHLYNYKQAQDIFPLKNFYTYSGNNGIFSKDKTDKFLDFILIDESEFLNKYNNLRTEYFNEKEQRVFMSYEKLQRIDRFLPKISFHYPFIISSDKSNMLLVSYSSFIEFMKLERLYMFIYENTKIKEFRSLIHGPAIENYLRKFAKEHTKAISVYGDEKYNPKKDDGTRNKRLKYDAPDVIIEFEGYVLFIECKSKPFDILKALKNYDKYDFSRFADDIDKSLINIENYINHKNSFNGKKKYKFVVYFFNHPMLLDTTLNELKGFDNVKPEEIIVTNIQTIERFLNINSKSLDLVLEKFYESYHTNKLTFDKYIKTDFLDEIDSKIVDREFHTFTSKYLREK